MGKRKRFLFQRLDVDAECIQNLQRRVADLEEGLHNVQNHLSAAPTHPIVAEIATNALQPLPCPCCGSDAMVVPVSRPSETLWRVVCRGCRLEYREESFVGEAGLRAAIMAWNKREAPRG